MHLTCDLGGTTSKLALIQHGRIAAAASLDHPGTQPIHDTLDAILLNARTLAQTARTPFAAIQSIGLAIPGIVDPAAARILSINDKHPGALHFDFTRWASQNGFSRIALENDARAALLGEHRFNPDPGIRTASTLAGVTLGTGIGVAVLLDGRLLHGSNHQAAINMGHTPIAFGPHATPCNCGGAGCAESHASTWALRQTTPWTSFKALFESLDQGDPAARRTLDHSLHAWAACLVSICYAYDPSHLILGGGLMHRHPDILPPLSRQMRAIAWNGFRLPPLVPSTLMQNAALLGMHALLSPAP